MISTESLLSPTQPKRQRHAGILLGLVGVLAFSLTLPATRVAVPELGPIIVGLGRIVIAAVLASIVLIVRRNPLPERQYWPDLAMVVAGVVIGFPLLTSFAMQELPASHGAIVVGIIPMTTAIWATVLHGERPSRLFWIGCAGGVMAVFGFATAQGAGQLQAADGLLLAAAFSAGLGYSFGAKLSKAMPPWRVLCWSLVISAVLVAPFCVQPAWRVSNESISLPAWLGLAWVSCGSLFCGFLAWYRGLAIGGVARVGQVQLVQPVLTMIWSALLLGERLNVATMLAAVGIIAAAAICLRAR